MRLQARQGPRRLAFLLLTGWLGAGLIFTAQCVIPPESLARVVAGPRGAVGVGPRGGVAARGPYGGAAYRGPRGGAAVRTPSGAAAARGPYGGAAVRGAYGGVAARGPGGAVVAAPRGRVVAPAPVVVAPAYYGPPAGTVAAGMALGAMLTVLPATAVRLAAPAGPPVYQVETRCYREAHRNGSTFYEQISCP